MPDDRHEEVSVKDEVLRLKNADPFSPFVLILTSGDRFEVTNPDMLATGETVIHIFKPRSNVYDIIRLSQIVAVQVLEIAA